MFSFFSNKQLSSVTCFRIWAFYNKTDTDMFYTFDSLFLPVRVCALVCDVTLRRRRKLFLLTVACAPWSCCVSCAVLAEWRQRWPRRTVNAIRNAGDLLKMGVETREIKSDANERSSWFVIYCFAWVWCVVVCVNTAWALLVYLWRLQAGGH